MTESPLIFLSAGEASGDAYGAELITALRAILPEARFTGLGGTRMEAAGQQRTVRAEDVAHMGITEILLHLPKLFNYYFILMRQLKQSKPDVAVLIDFPDVNFRLARHLKDQGTPILWFVSPQLWAWKKSRLRWVQQRVTRMLTIFPFEQPFYANRGVLARFVGHPLADTPATPAVNRQEFANTHGLDPAKHWVSLLPGSRSGEISANFPELIRAADLLGEDYEFLVPVAPTAAGSVLQHLHRTASATKHIHLTVDARTALSHSRAAVIASGTATVQAAVLGTPMVVIYRVSKLTFAAAKRLVSYPQEIPAQEDQHGNLPVAMPNLIAGRRIVPELLQQNFTAENIVGELKLLLDDSPPRQAQLEALAEVRDMLRSPTHQTAIEQLRDALLEALGAQSDTSSSASNR